MSTVRQQKLAHALIDNLKETKPKNKEQLVVSVGYSEMTGEKKATEVINSKGTKEALAALGFDEDNAKRVVGEILNKEYAEDKDRLKAADMIFEVFGTKAPEKHLNINVPIPIDNVRENNSLQQDKGTNEEN